ncbi:hypothetical protein [Patulibacter sp.]|uniref:hypothetical protein n=1 Tax=Patulibacter sp. TaxID=1912859 RepID=UPI002723230F|nr:hypothetical protein [Patulibacter sp.]MDO9409268.1 hypothetical protein [Patulibacter sp.]
MARPRLRAAGAVALLVVLVAVLVVLLPRGGDDERRTRTGATDGAGHQLTGLSVVPDPEGDGWLGVSHRPTGRGPADFAVGLATSKDLLHWTPVAELDADGGNMPVLHALPGGGYLLAYEDYVRVDDGNAISRIRVRAYADRARLLRNTWAVQRELPATLSDNNEGTPSFERVDWNGSAGASTITLRFHYNADAKGVDRQGIGTLRGFRDWTARRDEALDETLTRAGFPASHGRRSTFRAGGRPWMLIEVQRRPGDFSTWRLVLLDRGPAPRAEPTVVCGGDAGVPTAPSVGVPWVQIAPDGEGGPDLLFLSAFVFDGPSAGTFLARSPLPRGVAADQVAGLFQRCAPAR